MLGSRISHLLAATGSRANGRAIRTRRFICARELGPRHIIINCSTIGPEATVEIAQLVQATGANFLDAPFTGSKGAAEKSQLVYYVGGEEDVFLRPLCAHVIDVELELLSQRIRIFRRVGIPRTV